MIVSFIAAALIAQAQPLDAEYSTAGHPRSFGIDVTVRHPAAWKPQPFEVPNGVGRIVSPDGRQEIRLWISDEIVAFGSRGTEQNAASAEFDYVDSGALEKHFVEGRQVLTAGTFYLDGRPARLVEFAADGVRQIFVGCLSGRRAVLAVIGGLHGGGSNDDYAIQRPTYLEIAKSIRVRAESSWNSPWLVPIGIGAVVLSVIAVHRYMNRSKSGRVKSHSGKSRR